MVVTIFCDSAAKYLSEEFWTEAAAAGGELAMISTGPTANPLVLTVDQRRQIEQQGIAAFPNECCGAMSAATITGSTTRRIVERLVPMRNAYDPRRAISSFFNRSALS